MYLNTSTVKSLRVSEPVQMLFVNNRIILGFDTSVYTPELTQSIVPSGKFGVSFINQATNKLRNLILRDPVGEALELSYTATEDNIYSGMNMSKISVAAFNANNYYTRSEVDARVALVADGYVKSFSFNS